MSHLQNVSFASPIYLIQNVTYAFAKLIYEIQRLGLFMNYRAIWDKQELPDFLIEGIIQIAYTTREVFFRSNIGNVETYCKSRTVGSRSRSFFMN